MTIKEMRASIAAASTVTCLDSVFNKDGIGATYPITKNQANGLRIAGADGKPTWIYLKSIAVLDDEVFVTMNEAGDLLSIYSIEPITLEGKEIVAAIKALGVEAYVEHTGGGCATIYLGTPDVDGNYRAAVGPGDFCHSEALFDGETSVGSDYFTSARGDEEMVAHIFSHDPAVIAERAVAFYNAHPVTEFRRYEFTMLTGDDAVAFLQSLKPKE